MASLFGTLLAGNPPASLAEPGAALAACPASSNCVSSTASDAGHAVPALAFKGPAEAAMRRLAGIVNDMPGALVVMATPVYLRVEFASAVFGFVDDAEFVPDPAASVIHIRSAARMGSSDFGVNRKRVEAIRSAFTQKP